MNGAEAAKSAGLRYVTDDVPGIRRVTRGKRFAYIDVDGNEIRDEARLRRIKALAVPPAYVDVWICPFENGHVQATGRDARGRKQYRYHNRWREVRDENKYGRMIEFAKQLPKIREKISSDLALAGLPREKVLATVVELLQTTAIRIGNDEYAKANNSYGLTTLRNNHAKVTGSGVRFTFRGKSGVRHAIDLHDRRLARIIRQCQDLPGQQLFTYLDDDGQSRVIDSSEVNAYIRQISAEDFSAKDFRTWLGTVACAELLAQGQQAESQGERKSRVASVIRDVAKRLANTPAVCRKCYVHPDVIGTYMDEGSLLLRRSRAIEGLTRGECSVLALLRERAKLGESGRAKRQLQQSLRARKNKAA